MMQLDKKKRTLGLESLSFSVKSSMNLLAYKVCLSFYAAFGEVSLWGDSFRKHAAKPDILCCSDKESFEL